MARGNIYSGLLNRILQVIIEHGEYRAYSSVEVTEMLKLQGEWEGRTAKTPERTINSYFTQNPDIFKKEGLDAYRLQPEYRDKLASRQKKTSPDTHATPHLPKGSEELNTNLNEQKLSIQEAVELRLGLLSGRRHLDAFDRISMQNVTDDKELCRIYDESKIQSFSQFLALGEKRLKLLGYNRDSELLLKECLRHYLRHSTPLSCSETKALVTQYSTKKEPNKTLAPTGKSTNKSKHGNPSNSRKVIHCEDDQPPKSTQSAVEIGQLSIQEAVELRLGLLSGQRHLQIFDRLSMQDVTDDKDLCRIYNESGTQSFSHFLALGKKRLKLPGYNKESELALKNSLRNYLRADSPFNPVKTLTSSTPTPTHKSIEKSENGTTDDSGQITNHDAPQRGIQSSARLEALSIQDAVELRLGLLYGRNHLEAFDRLSMQDVTDNEELCRIYEESKIQSFSHFLALGKQRLLLPHYKQSSEQMLKDILRSFLRKITQKEQSEDSEQITQSGINPLPISEATSIEEQTPAIEPPHSPEQAASQPDFVVQLLDGSKRWELFDHKQMSDLTDDSALCAYYEKSQCKSLSEFLALSEKRFDIRGYWQPCEEMLQFALRSHLTIETPGLPDEEEDETNPESPSVSTTAPAAPSHDAIEGFVDELMAGRTTWQSLEQLEMKDLSSNNGLRYYYELSQCTNLSEFLEIPDKRFKIRGYWDGSEKRLKEELIKFFQSQAPIDSHQDAPEQSEEDSRTDYGQNFEDIPAPSETTTERRIYRSPINTATKLSESPLMTREGENLIQQGQRHRNLTAELMYGSIQWNGFDEMSMSDLTQHSALRKFYKITNVGSLSEFLALGRKRMSYKGYGNSTEQKLREALHHFFKKNSIQPTPIASGTEHEAQTTQKLPENSVETIGAVASIPEIISSLPEIVSLPQSAPPPEHSIDEIPSAQEDVDDFITELMEGSGNFATFDDLNISYITRNVRLCNCYDNSNAENLSAFLAIGKKRFALRNYGKNSEITLRESLSLYFKYNNIDSSQQIAPKIKPIQHDQLIEQLRQYEKVNTVLSKREWRSLRDEVKESKFCDRLIFSTSAEIGMPWPIGGKSPLSEKRIQDYIDLDITEMMEVDRFGKKKVAIYVACIIHLHRKLSNNDEETDKSLKGRVMTAWENSRLTEREKNTLRLRFGIDTRKHILEEIATTYKVTRERIRQIQKKALLKLKVSEDYDEIPKRLREEQAIIWKHLTGDHTKISKTRDIHELESRLPFEEHLAIEISTDRLHRGITSPALASWLDENFEHDESNWYNQLASSPVETEPTTHTNSGLVDFLDTL